jgi:hypothetical protein
MSSPNFQPILDAALDSYAKQTGIDLAKHPSANKLQNCRSPDDVLQILSERESAFKDYRDQYRNLIDRVRPVVKAVHALSAVLGEIAGFVSSALHLSHLVTSLRPPTGAISSNKSDICRRRRSSLRAYPPVFLVRSIYDPPLRQAAIGVSASYDALAYLFECVSNFLRRFQIYAEKLSLSPAMSDMWSR